MHLLVNFIIQHLENKHQNQEMEIIFVIDHKVF